MTCKPLLTAISVSNKTRFLNQHGRHALLRLITLCVKQRVALASRLPPVSSVNAEGGRCTCVNTFIESWSHGYPPPSHHPHTPNPSTCLYNINRSLSYAALTLGVERRILIYWQNRAEPLHLTRYYWSSLTLPWCCRLIWDAETTSNRERGAGLAWVGWGQGVLPHLGRVEGRGDSTCKPRYPCGGYWWWRIEAALMGTCRCLLWPCQWVR